MSALTQTDINTSVTLGSVTYPTPVLNASGRLMPVCLTSCLIYKPRWAGL